LTITHPGNVHFWAQRGVNEFTRLSKYRKRRRGKKQGAPTTVRFNGQKDVQKNPGPFKNATAPAKAFEKP